MPSKPPRARRVLIPQRGSPPSVDRRERRLLWVKRGLVVTVGLPLLVLVLSELTTVLSVPDGLERFFGEERLVAEDALRRAENACMGERAWMLVRAMEVAAVEIRDGRAMSDGGNQVRAYRATVRQYTHFAGRLPDALVEVGHDIPAGAYCGSLSPWEGGVALPYVLFLGAAADGLAILVLIFLYLRLRFG